MIPLNAPSLGEREEQYVLEALRSGWTTTGKFVKKFEHDFAQYVGRRHAIACSSGTSALWLAIMAAQLPAGKRVLTASYTCDAVASAAINATGQVPLVVDIDAGTWGMSAAETRMALDSRDDIGLVTFTHCYGVPARDTEEIVALCQERGILCIEDASEAHGAGIGTRKVGSYGDASIFSLRGEKTLGAGQFGVVVTDDDDLAARVHQYAHNGLPVPASLRYWSTAAGLNCQPAHLSAALACAQLERIDELVKARNEVHRRWVDLLAPWVGAGIEFQVPFGEPAFWLTGMWYLNDFTHLTPQDLGAALRERGVETRPAFYAIHMLPHCRGSNLTPCTISTMMLRNLLILPSGPRITPEQQEYTVDQMFRIMGRARRAA